MIVHKEKVSAGDIIFLCERYAGTRFALVVEVIDKKYMGLIFRYLYTDKYKFNHKRLVDLSELEWSGIIKCPKY